jgi:hypothetical protein
MANTRTHVLDQIMAWVRGEPSGNSSGGVSSGSSNSQRIHCLSGMAGTGRSIIERTIARACLNDGRLGASFLFSHGGGERETARTFVTTIAVPLAWLTQRRALRAAICDAVHEMPDIAQHALLDQWKRLVLQSCERMRAAAEAAVEAAAEAAAPAPVAAAAPAPDEAPAETASGAPPPPPLVIVVNALDECHSADEIAFVLALLSQTPGLAVVALCILVASRPEIPIREGLPSMPDSVRRHLVLHPIDSSVVGQDIQTFLRRSLAETILHGPLLPGTPDYVIVRQLERRAGGLFVWAATACRFIKEGGPNARRRLNMILQHQPLSSGHHPERKLNEIFTSILRNAVPVDVVEDEKEVH